MKLALSNCDVRAYRRRTTGWSLRLRTVLITSIGWNFPISCINRFGATLVLPGSQRIPFACSMQVDRDYAFSGESTITLDLHAVLETPKVEPCVVTVELDVLFDFGGTMPHMRHQQTGVLRVIGV